MIELTRSLLRGRPRPAAPSHLLATRELTAAMRQLRISAGDDLTSAVTMVNRAITSLYPDVTDSPAGSDGRAGPHLVTGSFLRTVEKGHHARLDLYTLPRWLGASEARDKTPLYTSRVPDWLVRAYDLAFCADGYLVDMFVWSSALLADQLRDPPRRVRDLPAHMSPGCEYEFLAEHFPDAGQRISALLVTQAELAVCLPRQRPSDRAQPWRPAPGDESTSEDDWPEGQLVAPDSQFVAGWLMRNTGTVPWRDRVLYRVGGYPGGVRTPPFVVVPDTEPGGSVRIECPMRAPVTAGTYRACLKFGWPDGTYCFPNTLLGVFVTLIVAPGDFVDPESEWADHAG